MVLCELAVTHNFFVTWFALTVLGALSQFILSGGAFYWLYWRPSYAHWRYKSNPAFPKPEKVRDEILQMLKSLVAATLCPALALYLTQRGVGKAYCGLAPSHLSSAQAAAAGYTWTYLVVQLVCFAVLSDLYESLYHWIGHRFEAMWAVHRHHHVFFNPTPFAVISDEPPDQLMRSAPLLVFPLLVPTNIDLLFVLFSVLFYGYGTYLHSGFELPFSWLGAHNKLLINTSYHHYLHHALSLKGRPLFVGFFSQAFDRIAGSVYTGACMCAECARASGKRSPEHWSKVEIPDYSVLLRPSFWLPARSRA